MAFESRSISVCICREGEPIYSETATLVSIRDDGGGEFVEVSQESGRISMDIDEWPAIKATIDEMIKACRSESGGD